VRTVTVAKREIGETVAFTGRIEAENESRLAFRIGGRMIERFVNVGDRVLCHEYRRSKRRCVTVREMKEGPSRSAIRC